MNKIGLLFTVASYLLPIVLKAAWGSIVAKITGAPPGANSLWASIGSKLSNRQPLTPIEQQLLSQHVQPNAVKPVEVESAPGVPFQRL